MTLKEILELLGSGCWLTVGTEEGKAWLYYGRTIELDATITDELKARKLVNIYIRDGRDMGANCCKLEPGLAIIVEGRENGRI